MDEKMKNLSPEERNGVLTKLEVPTRDELNVLSSGPGNINIPKFEDFKDQLTITPDSLNINDASLSAQQKEDIENAKLLAQLATDKKFDANKDPLGWYQHYTNILGHIGFTYSDIKMLKYNTSSTSVTVEKALLEILSVALTGNQVALLTTAIKALKDLGGDSKTLKLFTRNSSSTNFNNVKVACATLDKNGSPQISLGALTFTQSQVNGTFLFFFNYSLSNLDAQAGSTTLSLNEGVYSTVRNTIKTKLGQAANDFIDNLDI